MRSKIIILMFLLASMFVFLPASAATANAQIRVQIGNRHDRGRHYGWTRGRHLGWYQGRRAYWYNYDPGDRRYVRRYYSNNGRRVVRWYWNY